MRLLPVLALAACATSLAESTEPSTEAVPVTVVSLQSEPLGRPLHGVGRVRTADEVALAFPFGGVTADVLVKRGQAVKAGEVLAVLDAAAARAQLEVSRQALAKAERDAARAQALEGTALSEAQRQDALTGLAVAQAQVTGAAFQARRSSLRAPADGVIVEVQIEAGQAVAPGVPVVWFSGRGGWELELTLPAADALASDPGTPIEAHFAALDASVSGRVVARSGGAGPLGVWSLTLGLDETALPLASGLVATVDLRPTPADWPTVPFAALAEADGTRGALYTVDAEGLARRVPVQIAFLAGDRVALAEAPALGTPIVVAGVPFLTDGAPVRSDR